MKRSTSGLCAWIVGAILCSSVSAARFDIRQYGATPNDATDDTAAILRAIQACRDAGGGEVFVPAGTYRIARQGKESPILGLPSNTTLRGEGAASVLQFDPRLNQTDFWRMIGAAPGGCRNVIICDLHLDGSNTYRSYQPGKTPEQNHGVFLYAKEGVIENVTIRDCLIENFSGDCISIGVGCRNITVQNVAVRNFVRQGIQMAGGSGATGYLVTGCQDLEGTVRPGGSTIHVEHARGLTNVIIANNRCRHSILAGGVDGLVIRGNAIAGRLVGNNDKNTIIEGNVVRGDDRPGAVTQFGYADGLIIRGNVVTSPHAEAIGIYVWGSSRYNPAPSQNVLISDNLLRLSGRGVFLNGVRRAVIRGNLFGSAGAAERLVIQRTEEVDSDVTGPNRNRSAR